MLDFINLKPNQMKYKPIIDIPFQYMVTDEDYAQAEKWANESKFTGNEFTIFANDRKRLIRGALGEIAFQNMFPFFKKTANSSFSHDFLYNNTTVDVKVGSRDNTNASEYYEYGFPEYQKNSTKTHYAFFHYNINSRNIQLIGVISKENFLKYAHKQERGNVEGSNNYTPMANYLKMYAVDIMKYCELQQIINLKPISNQNQIMSNYQKKDGDISVFTNQSANANAPRWKGNLLLNGQEYSVSLWVKNGAKGEFLAGSVQPKQAPVANTYNQYDQGNDPF